MRESGFSLIEAIVATIVLTIGVVGVAATIGSAVRTTDDSKYTTIASTLVTEKMEDLSRWPANDTSVSAGGSLTADTAGYFDNISMAADGGNYTEVSGTTGSYVVVTINPQNNPVPSSATVATSPAVPVTFDRRWLIETGPTVNGVVLTGARRITVWIQSVGAIKPPITFQMSMVRP